MSPAVMRCGSKVTLRAKAYAARCDGVKKTFTGTWQKLYVNGSDLPSVRSTISAKLKQDPTIDFIVTLGAPIALNAIDAACKRSAELAIGHEPDEEE